MRLLLLGLPWGLLAPAAHGAEPPPTPATGLPSPAERAVEDAAYAVPPPQYRNFECRSHHALEEDMIGDAREGLDEMLCEANLWLDGLFTDGGDPLAAQRTSGQLSMSTQFSERLGWDFKLRLRVRVDLRALEDRLSAFIGREPDADFVSGRSEGFALREQFPVLEDEDQWLAGLGYDIPSGYRLRSSFKVGARRLKDTEIFVRNRVQWNPIASPDHVFHIRAIPFWTNHDEFGLTAGFDYAYALSSRALLRFDTVGTVSDSTEEVDWRSVLVAYRSLASETGIAAEIYGIGDSGHREWMREYGLRAILRMPLSPQRLYVLFSLGEAWYQPPENDVPRKTYFNSSIVLELPFGR